MLLKGNYLSIKQFLCLCLYYGLLRKLPASTSMFGGRLYKKMRYKCCKNLFKKCGKNVNIEHGATFGSGLNIEIGDNSGIGINAYIPGDTVIGDNVMMGPNCYILSTNHSYDRIDIPMNQQGNSERKTTIIEDDVWIGRNVTFTPGRIVRKGTIIGASCVLTKDFPEYSVVGGNPAKFIKSRLDEKNCNNN